MQTKAKTFDCVEMKRQAQAAILAEWERRKTEFSSFGEYVETAARESEWARRVLARSGHAARST
jgi:hypothetical protein